MTNRTTTHHLEVKSLLRKGTDEESLKNATPLQSYESSTSFGAFHVGDGFTDGPNLAYFGKIQHIHHFVGDFGEDQVLHKTVLYVYEEDEHRPPLSIHKTGL